MSKVLLLFFFLPFFNRISAQEICNNGKDDDDNGLIDLKDPACQCRLQTAQNLLINPSFDSFSHCPANQFIEDSDMAIGWTNGTDTRGTLGIYFNYSCPGDSMFLVRHYPYVPQPLPGGKGLILITQGRDPLEKKTGKDYIGQCLNKPLLKDKEYTMTINVGFGLRNPQSPIISPLRFGLGIYGSSDCSAIPFGNGQTGCPLNTPGWKLLGETVISGKDQWVEGKVKLTIPENINAILIGPDCSLQPEVPGVASFANFLDNVQLAETKDFNFQYIGVQSGSACAGNYILKAPVQSQPGGAYQWYRDSIAITGATAATYSVPDSITKAFYNVRITTAGGCQTTEPFALQRSSLYALQLPADTFICKNDTLTLAGSLPGVQYRWNGITDTKVRISQPGTYDITATDALGCKKTFSVKAIFRECVPCTVFVPSAFTPNGDGKNDLLRGRINCPVDEYHLQVYNRWGQRVFETQNLNAGWDGLYGGKKAPGGAYVYLVRFKNSVHEKHYKHSKGTIVLIR